MEELFELERVLKRKNYQVKVFDTGEDACRQAVDMIKGKTVGWGGSVTLKTLDMYAIIKEHAKEVYSHLPGAAGEDERKALTAQIYFTSANAISLDGHIVNIDGTGNRVAATCFGPHRVIYFIGKNKVAKSLDDAMQRAKYAAVTVAKNFNRKTPCVITGKCEDCLSDGCVCSVTTIHRKKPKGIDISVFLINEELGF